MRTQFDCAPECLRGPRQKHVDIEFVRKCQEPVPFRNTTRFLAFDLVSKEISCRMSYLLIACHLRSDLPPYPSELYVRDY